MLATASVLVAAGVLVGALVAGGGAWVPGGILNPGRVVGWSLPVVRMLTDLAVVAAFGHALLALLFPCRRGALTSEARTALRTAAAAACAAAVLMALTAVLTFAAVIGSGATSVLQPGMPSSLLHLGASSHLLLSSVLLLATALAAGWAAHAHGPDRALAPLILGAIALVPVALTGHATTGGAHLVAITALEIHLVSVCTWVGGLGALAGYSLRHGRALAAVLPRYSRVAAVCFATVAVSGLASAAARLTALPELVRTDYGRIVLAKTACFLSLGLAAWCQRRRVVPSVAAATARAVTGTGSAVSAGPAAASSAARRAFSRLASAELLVMTATVGLAVALSRTPTPPAAPTTTTVEAELGYPMPPPVTAWHLLTYAWYDPVVSTLAVIAVTLYLAGVARLRHRGDRWPVRRTMWWVSGWALAVVATCSGLGRYGSITFSGHMVQHMLLSMLAPLPMVLGAPVPLALEALAPAPPNCRGPSEWLGSAVDSRVAAALGSRWVGVLLVAVSLFGLYFTPLFGELMSGHGGHLAVNVFFLGSGYQFHSALYPRDDRRVRQRRTRSGITQAGELRGRLGLLAAAAVLHAAFAVALIVSTTVIARSWYSGLDVGWVPSLIADQHRAGELTWPLGVLPLVVALGLLFRRGPTVRLRAIVPGPAATGPVRE